MGLLEGLLEGLFVGVLDGLFVGVLEGRLVGRIVGFLNILCENVVRYTGRSSQANTKESNAYNK